MKLTRLQMRWVKARLCVLKCSLRWNYSDFTSVGLAIASARQSKALQDIIKADEDMGPAIEAYIRWRDAYVRAGKPVRYLPRGYGGQAT